MKFKVYKENIQELLMAYPEVFDKKNPKPLSKHAFDTLVKFFPMPKDELMFTLNVWTNRLEYVRAFQHNSHRWHLDGTVAEKIDEDCYKQAMKSLDAKNSKFQRMMFKKRANIDEQEIKI